MIIKIAFVIAQIVLLSLSHSALVEGSQHRRTLVILLKTANFFFFLDLVANLIVYPLYDKNDPNSLQNVPEGDMAEELYCAWPEVAVDLKAGASGEFLMYYSTMLKESKDKAIGLATSPDGFRWTKQGICLRPDSEGLDSAGIARCAVVKDAVFDDDLEQWEELNAWKMYYEGVSPLDNKHRIMVAESQDGRAWKKIGVALDVGAEGAWDCGGAGAPHIVR